MTASASLLVKWVQGLFATLAVFFGYVGFIVVQFFPMSRGQSYVSLCSYRQSVVTRRLEILTQVIESYSLESGYDKITFAAEMQGDEWGTV